MPGLVLGELVILGIGDWDFGNWRLEFCRDAKMLVKVE